MTSKLLPKGMLQSRDDMGAEDVSATVKIITGDQEKLLEGAQQDVGVVDNCDTKYEILHKEADVIVTQKRLELEVADEEHLKCELRLDKEDIKLSQDKKKMNEVKQKIDDQSDMEKRLMNAVALVEYPVFIVEAVSPIPDFVVSINEKQRTIVREANKSTRRRVLNVELA
jgi:maltodextrin utilization protein YvdJ